MSQTKNKSINSRLQELEAVLAWFDSDDIDLDEALDKFETGSQIVSDIRERLNEVHNKITVLEKRFDS